MGRYADKMRFTVTDLGNGYDVILGMPWLEDMQPSITWREKKLMLDWQGKVLTIEGGKLRQVGTSSFTEETAKIQFVGETSIRRAAAEPGSEVLLFVVREAPSQEEGVVSDPELQQVLDDFKDVLEAKRQIDELLEKGYIRPSKSPFGAPILFVRKKNGGLRMCIDYRGLNSITKRNTFPIPRIDELLESLTGARYFTKIDLAAGYHQIRVADGDEEKTAFNTRFGHYEWLVLSFGMTNAPASFQTLMNDVFKDLLFQGVVVYLDDILVYSKTKEEHLIKLRVVLSRLRENNLYAQRNKSDASDLAVGAVLQQDHGAGLQPVAYFSRKLKGVELNWNTSEKETLAQETSEVVGVLSAVQLRHPICPGQAQSDMDAREARKEMQARSDVWAERNGLLWHSANVYWPTLKRDVRDYVSLCDTCQRTKASRQKPAGFGNPCTSFSIPSYCCQPRFIHKLMDRPKELIKQWRQSCAHLYQQRRSMCKPVCKSSRKLASMLSKLKISKPSRQTSGEGTQNSKQAYKGSPPERPPPVWEDGEPEYEVEAVLRHRHVRGKLQVLVLWLGYPLTEATWEPVEHLKNAPIPLQEYATRVGLVLPSGFGTKPLLPQS